MVVSAVGGRDAMVTTVRDIHGRQTAEGTLKIASD
jgi:hypothetical protein